jgi:hypothetical protein
VSRRAVEQVTGERPGGAIAACARLREVGKGEGELRHGEARL